MEHKLTIRPEADKLRVADMLMESLDEGVWLWNIEQGVFDVLNPAAQAVFGSDLSRYNQDPEKWVFLIHPEDRERVLHATTRTLFSESRISIEYRIELGNGGYRWVSDSRKLILNEAGKPIQVFGCLKDITQRKNHDLHIEESELTYKIMFLHHPSPMWVVSCAEGNILEANEAAIKSFGYSRKEFSQINFKDFVGIDSFPQDEKDFGLTHTATSLIKRNGKQAKVILSGANYIYRGQKAKLILAIDITREMADEEKIKALNKRLSDFKYALTSSAIVSITDKNGIINYVNENFLKVSGYERDELIGARHNIVNSGYHPPSFFKDMWRQISQGHIWRNSIRNKTKKGTFYWVDTYIVPLLDNKGVPEQYISIRSDISQRHKAEEALAELNKQLEDRVKKRTQDLELANSSLQDFANSISHDLRAPVRHIRNFAQIVLDQCQNAMDEESRKYQGYVIEATDKLSEQIEGLLQFSRVGSKLIHFMEVDVHKMALYAMEQAKMQYPLQPCQFHINQHLPKINADQVLLEQVFANLFSNAIKYSSKQSETAVWLNYVDIGEFHRFEIKDNGVGFNMMYAQKLFHMFSRLHGQSEFEGNGIGLVNVKKIVERHQGKVWAYSEPNKGASFFFTLPKNLENEGTNISSK